MNWKHNAIDLMQVMSRFTKTVKMVHVGGHADDGYVTLLEINWSLKLNAT